MDPEWNCALSWGLQTSGSSFWTHFKNIFDNFSIFFRISTFRNPTFFEKVDPMWPLRPIPSVENDRISILSISTFHTKVSKTSVFTMFSQRFQEKALFPFKPSESIFSRIMYSWDKNIIFLEYYELTNGNCSSANWSMAKRARFGDLAGAEVP